MEGTGTVATVKGRGAGSASGGWRDRIRDVDPVLLVVCLTVATTQAAWSVVVPVLPAYTATFGATATELGLVIAMFGVGRLLMNLPAGVLSTRVDARKLLVVAVVGVVAFQAATAFAPSLEALLALRLATGLAGGAAITSGMTLIADLTHTTNRGRAMALLQGVQLVGGAIGPPLGGLVAMLWDYRMPFLVCGTLAGLVLAFGGRTLLRAPQGVSEPSSRQGVSRYRTESDGERRGSLRRLLADRSYLAICAVGFSVFLHRFGGVQSLIPLIAYTVVGLSVSELGLVLGIVTACNLVMLSLAGALSDRVGRKRVIVPGMLVIATFLPLYLVSTHAAWFIAVTVVTGVAAGFSGPTPAAYVADVAPSNGRGPAVGMYRTFGDLAGIVGPISLGWLVDHTGYQMAVVVLAAVIMTTILVFAFVARETVQWTSRRVLRNQVAG
ncbi:putative MFS family arabinose efflux permease [Thermasporomyces composti]|jgi:DHA1 family multidrug resistance protein-like MFS transporter|uniref:Putative MFS family arabinose efflux permease n=1 Tax=Thermasporomyces composti TaxID=696763 RepID=A0A3D9V893_THECX|nr:putative MFS family arabinose efflux permease [Thermasporomyces composti]